MVVPNIIQHVSSKQPLAGDTASGSGTGFEGVGVETLVAACRGHLSTYVRHIGAIGLLAALYSGAYGTPASSGLRPPCNGLILIIAPNFGCCLESAFQIRNMQPLMKWYIMYPYANHCHLLKICCFIKSCNLVKQHMNGL